MQAGKPLKVMIVDDTIVYRKIVSDVLSEIPGVRVVGAAHNGKAALLKIKALQPDLLTLDIEMPEMSGLELLERMRTEAPDVGAVMLSTLTQEGGAMTMRALELGAFDFMMPGLNGLELLEKFLFRLGKQAGLAQALKLADLGSQFPFFFQQRFEQE